METTPAGISLREIAQAFTRGSRLIAENVGATLPVWAFWESDNVVGQKLLDAFNHYAEREQIEIEDALRIREAIMDQWGLSDKPRVSRLTVGEALSRYR